MTRPDLDQLVMQARRDRPPAEALLSVARRLRVPFVVAPVVAAVVPSSAFAAILTKLGVGRLTLFGWSVGSAAVVAGGVTALALSSPAPSPLDRAAVAPRPVVTAPSEPQSAPAPSLPTLAEEVPAPPRADRAKPRDVATTWDEPQLIERARKALGAEPRRALALTQEHQRRFPSGALSLEREVIAIEALSRSGQPAEARRRAVAFEAAHPTSIHLPRVRAVLSRLGAR
jgi:pimeloyl-ACP methyl ester carboxylesterase